MASFLNTQGYPVEKGNGRILLTHPENWAHNGCQPLSITRPRKRVIVGHSPLTDIDYPTAGAVRLSFHYRENDISPAYGPRTNPHAIRLYLKSGAWMFYAYLKEA
jgi:hypothetical protein